MSSTISPLNGDNIRLGCAAVIIARERECCTADDIMDVLKRALFLGDLDPPRFAFGTTREDPSNWLHKEIAEPKCWLPLSQAALKVRPKQLYGVGRETVASVLLTSDALPGDRAHWEQMLDTFAPADEQDSAFSALAAIPFRDFPARGRQELKSILAPKPAWKRIVELVRHLHQQHPEWQNKQLAFQAWLRLTAEFSEEELPSVTIIQRSMPEILDDEFG
jgi:hypothetical protein